MITKKFKELVVFPLFYVISILGEGIGFFLTLNYSYQNLEDFLKILSIICVILIVLIDAIYGGFQAFGKKACKYVYSFPTVSTIITVFLMAISITPYLHDSEEKFISICLGFMMLHAKFQFLNFINIINKRIYCICMMEKIIISVILTLTIFYCLLSSLSLDNSLNVSIIFYNAIQIYFLFLNGNTEGDSTNSKKKTFPNETELIENEEKFKMSSIDLLPEIPKEENQKLKYMNVDLHSSPLLEKSGQSFHAFDKENHSNYTSVVKSNHNEGALMNQKSEGCSRHQSVFNLESGKKIYYHPSHGTLLDVNSSNNSKLIESLSSIITEGLAIFTDNKMISCNSSLNVFLLQLKKEANMIHDAESKNVFDEWEKLFANCVVRKQLKGSINTFSNQEEEVVLLAEIYSLLSVDENKVSDIDVTLKYRYQIKKKKFPNNQGTIYDIQLTCKKCDKKIYVFMKATNITKHLLNANLESGNRFKDFLISSLSHEIKTPLGNIMGHLKVLKTNFDQKILQKTLNTLKLFLIAFHGIMQMAAAQSGNLVSKKNVFSIPLIIQKMCDIFRPYYEERGLQLIFNPSKFKNVPNANTDKMFIQIIIFHFLSNALKYTTEGHVQISVEYVPSTEDVVIAFLDTGCGMDEQTQNKLRTFLNNKPRMIGELINKNSTGVNIGMMTCMALIGQLHPNDMSNCQRIWFESVYRKGSTFFVKINLCEIDQKSYTKSIFSDKKSYKTFQNQLHGKSFRTLHSINSTEKKDIFRKSFSITKSQLKKKKFKYFATVGKQEFDYEKKLSDFLSQSDDDICSSKKQSTVKSGLSSWKVELSLSEVHHPYLAANNYNTNFKFITNLKKMAIPVQPCICPKRILVVDDEEYNIQLFRMEFDKHNKNSFIKNQIYLCRDATSSVNIVKKLIKESKCHSENCQPINLIVMDYNLPDMNGVEATKLILDHCRLQNLSPIPVYGWTAFVGIKYSEEFMKAGAAGMLNKPAKTSEIKNLLIKYNFVTNQIDLKVSNCDQQAEKCIGLSQFRLIYIFQINENFFLRRTIFD